MAPGVPLVSVLIPARDASDTIDACLRSVHRQRFRDWECVLVDDGSADDTSRTAERWAADDARFRPMRTPARGVVAALNEGLSRCRGALVARMDADDVMHRDRLGVQAAALSDDPSLAAVGCHVRMFPRATLTSGRRAYEDWLNSLRTADDIRRDAFIECPVAHPALMIRREVLADGGYEDNGLPEDYHLVLRLLARGRRVGTVARRLIGWRERSGRLSRTDARYGLDRFTACKAAFLAEGFLGGHDTFALWGYGDTGKTLRRALEQRGKQPSVIIEVHPGRLGQRIHGVPVRGLDALRALRGQPVVVSVAGRGPRTDIRAYLADLGFVELRDFVCAA